MRRSGLPREEVFLTSKIPGRHHGYDDAIASVRTSLETLRTDYLDHLAPLPDQEPAPGLGGAPAACWPGSWPC